MIKRSITLFTLMCFTLGYAWAQPKVGVDFASNFIWRGAAVSEIPAVQPSLKYSWKKLTVGTWGTYSFDPDGYREQDFFLSLSLGNFTLMLNDYFIFDLTGLLENKLFDYNNATTQHLLEGGIQFGGNDKYKFDIAAYVNVYGSDFNADNRRQYSSYLEFGYKSGNFRWFAGFTPAQSMYAQQFAVVNLGVTAGKEIPLTEKFTLPLSLSLVTNPDAQKMWLMAILSF